MGRAHRRTFFLSTPSLRRSPTLAPTAGPRLRTLSPLATAATASSSSTMRTVPTSGPPSLALPTTATVVLDLLLALPRHPRRLAPLLPAMALSAPALPRPSATQSASPIPPLRSRRSLPLRLTPRLPFPLRPAQLVFPQPRQSLLNPPTVPLLSVSVSKTAVEVGGVSFSLSLANSVVEGVSGDGISSGSGGKRNGSSGLLGGEKGSSDKAGNLVDGALESSVISGDGFVSSGSPC